LTYHPQLLKSIIFTCIYCYLFVPCYFISETRRIWLSVIFWKQFILISDLNLSQLISTYLKGPTVPQKPILRLKCPKSRVTHWILLQAIPKKRKLSISVYQKCFENLLLDQINEENKTQDLMKILTKQPYDFLNVSFISISLWSLKYFFNKKNMWFLMWVSVLLTECSINTYDIMTL